MLAGVNKAVHNVNKAVHNPQAMGVAHQVAPQYIPPPPPPPMWSSRLTQFSGEPVKGEDWIWACCCTQCASSMAKSKVDKTHPCLNFLYWTPIGAYSYVRVAYGIEGVCGDDMGYGMFCPWCTTRQILTESNIRGIANPQFGANINEWKHSLFDCTPCDLCEVTFCLPCAMHEIRMGLPGQLKATSCCFDCLCLVPNALYGQTRNDHGILSDFGVVEDICIPLFCFPCSLVRARKENRWHLTQGQAGVQAMQGGVQSMGGRLF